MNTSLLAQSESESPIILCESNPRTAAKHAAACEKARKAYLRAVYGFQPSKGTKLGFVLSAIAHGSIVVVEIRFPAGGKGTFELPLHVFKKATTPIASSLALKDFVHSNVWVTVTDRYQFDGISLSNVIAIYLRSADVYAKLKSTPLHAVPR